MRMLAGPLPRLSSRYSQQQLQVPSQVHIDWLCSAKSLYSRN